MRLIYDIAVLGLLAILVGFTVHTILVKSFRIKGECTCTNGCHCDTGCGCVGGPDWIGQKK